MDISKGGLSFCYINGRDWLDTSYELDIFYGDDDFCLNNIPFETVFDCIFMHETPSPTKPINLRSVKFGDLTPKQQYQLSYFLEANTKPDDEAD